MFNDFKGFDENDRPVRISVPPTLLVSSMGIVNDVRNCITPDVKLAGERIYLLGVSRDELGCSEYYALMGEMLQGARFIGKNVPRVDADTSLKTYKAFHHAVQDGLVGAAASLGSGGLAVAAARMALAGNLGLDLDLSEVNTDSKELRADSVLYTESQGRILVSVPREKEETFADLFRGLPCCRIGEVVPEHVLRIRTGEQHFYVEAGLDELRDAYKKTLWW